MLQVNNMERINIAGILNHPWFGTSMKEQALSINQGLLDMPDSMLTGTASLPGLFGTTDSEHTNMSGAQEEAQVRCMLTYC